MTIDTVEFTTENGTSGPIPYEEFEDRANAAVERIRARTGEQLSFDTGAGFKATPDFATLKIAGQFGVTRDLRYKEAVNVTVTDLHGEVICSGPATVGWPAFKDKTSGELTFTERAHTASID